MVLLWSCFGLVLVLFWICFGFIGYFPNKSKTRGEQGTKERRTKPLQVLPSRATDRTLIKRIAWKRCKTSLRIPGKRSFPCLYTTKLYGPSSGILKALCNALWKKPKISTSFINDICTPNPERGFRRVNTPEMHSLISALTN